MKRDVVVSRGQFPVALSMIAVTVAIRRLKFDKTVTAVSCFCPRVGHQSMWHDCDVAQITPVVSNFIYAGAQNTERILHVEVL